MRACARALNVRACARARSCLCMCEVRGSPSTNEVPSFYCPPLIMTCTFDIPSRGGQLKVDVLVRN